MGVSTNGVVIYYLECSYSNNGNVANMFQVKGSVLIQGFRLKLDHDTGDGVSWDDEEKETSIQSAGTQQGWIRGAGK